MFCGDCGESLATAESPPVIAQEKQPSIESACPHCGERVSSEDLICGACGTPLKESSIRTRKRKREKKEKSPKTLLVVLSVFVLVIAVLIGGYFVLREKHSLENYVQTLMKTLEEDSEEAFVAFVKAHPDNTSLQTSELKPLFVHMKANTSAYEDALLAGNCPDMDIVEIGTKWGLFSEYGLHLLPAKLSIPPISGLTTINIDGTQHAMKESGWEIELLPGVYTLEGSFKNDVTGQTEEFRETLRFARVNGDLQGDHLSFSFSDEFVTVTLSDVPAQAHIVYNDKDAKPIQSLEAGMPLTIPRGTKIHLLLKTEYGDVISHQVNADHSGDIRFTFDAVLLDASDLTKHVIVNGVDKGKVAQFADVGFVIAPKGHPLQIQLIDEKELDRLWAIALKNESIASGNTVYLPEVTAEIRNEIIEAVAQFTSDVQEKVNALSTDFSYVYPDSPTHKRLLEAISERRASSRPSHIVPVSMYFDYSSFQVYAMRGEIYASCNEVYTYYSNGKKQNTSWRKELIYDEASATWKMFSDVIIRDSVANNQVIYF
jgi:uncharacterized membrane protein YvbJ